MDRYFRWFVQKYGTFTRVRAHKRRVENEAEGVPLSPSQKCFIDFSRYLIEQSYTELIRRHGYLLFMKSSISGIMK